MSEPGGLTTRVIAAYQFAAQSLGDQVSITDIRLHLHDIGDVGPERLYPLLRELHGTEVSFVCDTPGYGRLNLQEPPLGAPLHELDDSVTIEDVDYTHLSITPVQRP